MLRNIKMTHLKRETRQQNYQGEGFEVLTAMKFEVVVFWVVMPFGGPCCLHLQGEVSWPWN
jgi:hypothetical protein